jgi:hypothetical protein
MVLFKKQYLRQTIHRQIQIGVAIVSLSVCVLALILLTLSSFVIINLSYYDLISIIDEKENESLEGMGAYADMGLVNMVEMKKFTLEFIRRFINNNKENKDFIKNINFKENETGLLNVDSEEYQTFFKNPTEDKLMTTIVYKVLKENTPERQEDLNFYKNILITAIPLFRKILDYRFNYSTDTKIFDYIEILSNELSTVFYYPASPFKIGTPDKEYIYTDFKYTLSIISDWCSYDYDRIKNKVDDNEDFNKFFQETILNNPLMTLIYNDEDYLVPFTDAFKTTPLLVSTRGINYKDLPFTKDNAYDYLYDWENLRDVISGHSNSAMIETYVHSLIKRYKTLKILMTIASKQQILLSSSLCIYLRNLYHKYSTNPTKEIDEMYLENEKENFLKNVYSVDYCFQDQIANEKFKSFFYPYDEVGTPVYKYITRKAKFKFANSNSTMPDKAWKVFKINTPDIKSLVHTRSKFPPNYFINFYLVNNPLEISNKINQVTAIFIHIMMLILYSNSALWCLCIFVILILLYDTAAKISKPIKNITDLVNSIQINQKHGKDLNSIRFPDDKDIDGFFKVCIKLIRGGFCSLDENEHKDKIIKENCSDYCGYNNVAIVKSNNLIIREDLIDNKSLTSSIFVPQEYQNLEESVDSSNKSISFNMFNTNGSSKFDSSDHLGSYYKFNYNTQCGTVFGSNYSKSSKRNENSNDVSILSDNISDSFLIENIYEIIKKEDDLIKDKSYLYDIFQSKTNNGEDLKFVMFKNE